MLHLSNVKNIIFDLGNVILNLDFEASISAFQKLGMNKTVVSPKQAYADPLFYQLETGRITSGAFRKGVRELLQNQELTDRQIDEAWYAMIRDIPGKRVRILQKLKRNYQLYLFSNTNTIHMGYLLPEFKAQYGFEFQELFNQAFYSYEINARKPDIQSFKKVIELSGVNPEETLFVDDLNENTEAAEKVGLKTLWLKEDMEMSELF
jgi:glucose-1-phosphatase